MDPTEGFADQHSGYVYERHSAHARVQDIASQDSAQYALVPANRNEHYALVNPFHDGLDGFPVPHHNYSGQMPGAGEYTSHYSNTSMEPNSHSGYRQDQYAMENSPGNMMYGMHNSPAVTVNHGSNGSGQIYDQTPPNEVHNGDISTPYKAPKGEMESPEGFQELSDSEDEGSVYQPQEYDEESGEQEEKPQRATSSSGPYKLNFTDIEDFRLAQKQKVKAERARKQAELAANNDHSDFPEDDPETQQAYVMQLYNAITDTSEVIDNVKRDKTAQSVVRFQKGFYPKKEIEIVCWELLTKCRDASLGIRLSKEHTRMKREHYHGFAQRWNVIVEGCLKSKAMCKQLLDPLYADRYVDAPLREVQTKLNNIKINKERDVQNRLGRSLIKKGIDMKTIEGLPAVEVKTEGHGSGGTKGRQGSIQTPTKTSHRTSVKTSSSKRKRPSAAMYDDSSDFSDYTPKKKVVKTPKSSTKKGSSKRSSAKANKGSGLSMEDTADAFMATDDGRHNTPSKVLETPNKTLFGAAQSPASELAQKVGVGLHVATPESTSKSPPAPHNPAPAVVSREDLEKVYKFTLCEILDVSKDFTKLSLDHLRTYAASYNNDFAGQKWFDATQSSRAGGNHTISGPKVIHTTANGTIELHISQFYGGGLIELAKARGDLTPDGEFNEKASSGNGFNVGDDKLKLEALGIISNLLGRHPFHFVP